MLKFFRRIRKRLLESGKIRNYSLYAIGEIVLVVIGILIALQINNWNENRKEKAIAADYLTALKNEFQANIADLERVIVEADSVFKNSLSIFQNFTKTNGKPNLTEKEINTFLVTALHQVEFRPQMGVINDIINSGKTSLFKNDTLRNFISSWEGAIQIIQGYEVSLHGGQDFMVNHLYEYGNFHKYSYYVRNEKILNSTFERGNLPLLEMVSFEGAISVTVGNSIDLRNTIYPQFKEKLEEQIAIIDRELE